MTFFSFIFGLVVGYAIAGFLPWATLRQWILNQWQKVTKKG